MYDRKEFGDAVDYIHGLGELGWKLGLERFTALCERLDNPHQKIKAVHVGGTNGKGSTVAMIAGILRSAGYRTGAYYSPYVYDIRERVQLDGELIGESAFARLVGVIRPYARELGETEFGHPTEFEVKTALALLYFVERKADLAVLEVGLGGRLDATNVVSPLVSVITNVTLDHADRLGGTIPQIAFEKAGIVKGDGHLVTAVSNMDALAVIQQTCRERNSLLWHVRRLEDSAAHYAVTEWTGGYLPGDPESSGSPRDGKRALTVDGVGSRYENLQVGMRGEFQFVNAATAVGAVEALGMKGIEVPERAVRSGLKEAYLPGRLEVLCRKPQVVVDGAHNADGARRLARALRTEFAYDRLILVMGMVSGHSIEDVVGALAPMADSFIATAPDSPRAASAEELAAYARSYCPDVPVIMPVREAVRRALSTAGDRDLVCITGSFYTVGEVPRDLAGLAAGV